MTLEETAVDIAGMAKILSVSTDTIYRMARSGDIPGFKVKGVWRFFPSKVIAHLEQPPRDPWQQSARSRARRRIG